MSYATFDTLKPPPEADTLNTPLDADTLITIDSFLQKYNLDDAKLASYNNDTKRIITEIINGEIDKYVDSENYIILSYIANYYKYIKKDNSSAEKYYLMNIECIRNLGHSYRKQCKFDLASETAFGGKILSYGNRTTR